MPLLTRSHYLGINVRPLISRMTDYAHGGSTLDANGYIHSINDEPVPGLPTVKGRGNYRKWYSHGLLHRDNGPAVMEREGLPIHREWFVNGRRHCSTEPAYRDGNDFSWILFGCALTEEHFQEVTSFSQTHRVPVWASFLLSIKQISEESLTIAQEEDGTWNNALPLEWVLRSWGINCDTPMPYYDAYEKKEHTVAYEYFLNITSYLENLSKSNAGA